MAVESESPKREPGPSTSLSSIPAKRALDDDHSPAVPSPLKPTEAVPADEAATAAPASRSKPARVKKDTLKKREAKGGDSNRATPDPKTEPEPEPDESNAGPLRYKLAPPKPSDFDPPRGPLLTSHHEVTDREGNLVEFFETSDHVSNKKNFRYTHCIADPLFPSSIYYRQTEPEPFGSRMSFEDAASHVYFDKEARRLTTNKGFRMARGNTAVRQGRWYWECKIISGVQQSSTSSSKPESRGHVRMGWSRREASLDAPVGFDAYSYGIRDVSGEKVFMSRPKDFFPPGEGIREGDVIGLEIQLPSEHLQRKIMAGHYNPAIDAEDDEVPPATDAPNIVRDRVPIRFKAHTYFEKIEYHTTKELEDLMNPSPSNSTTITSKALNPLHRCPALRTLPGSYIKIYKNGQLMGTAFENLLGFLPPASKPLSQVGAREGFDDGMLGYYPAISVFRGGAAEVNFGPDFWFPPPDYRTSDGNDDNDVDMVEPGNAKLKRVRAMSERYADQIAEDVVYDIIDEVDFWVQDGGDGAKKTGLYEEHEAIKAPEREEIKELVQDD